MVRLVKALEISKEQQDKLNALNQEYQQKQRASLGRASGHIAPENFAKMLELGHECDMKALEILSKTELDKFAELKGRPFDLTQLRRPGSGGKKEDKKE